MSASASPTPAERARRKASWAAWCASRFCPRASLVLIWDYAKSSALKGFRVYASVAGGPERLLATQNPEVTLYLPDPPQPGGYASACFRVAALVRDQESRPSAWFCGDKARLIQTVMLKPIAVRTTSQSNDQSHETSPMNDNDKFVTGYFFDVWQESGLDFYSNSIFRAAARFDPGPLAGHQIFSAKLRLQVESTCSGADLDKCVDKFTSCGARLFEGSSQDPWWRDDGWIDVGPPAAHPGVTAGPDIVIDITPTVQGWVSGQPNNGLVLTGDNENIVHAPVEAKPKCTTGYDRDSMALEVSYFEAAPSSPNYDVHRLQPHSLR